MTLNELEELWACNANLRAFAMGLRLGEGTSGPDGYRTLFGATRFYGKDGLPDTFDDFSDHPRIAVSAKLKKGGVLTSTAAGAYQALEHTWDEENREYGFPDFSPHSQDLFCAARIVKRGAMPDVLAGRIEAAVLKCNREWASLPESPYGQPTVKMADFVKAFDVALAHEAVIEAQGKAGIRQVALMATDDPVEVEHEPLPKVGWVDALRVGQVVLDPAKLKNRGTVIALVTLALAAIAQFGGKYGLDLSWLDKDTASQIAGVIGTLVVVYVNYASSDKVGILPAKRVVLPPDPGPDPTFQDGLRLGG